MSRTTTASRRALAGSLIASGIALLGASSAAAASITGVCPDGSMFIVPRAELVPCQNAKAVDPGNVPPIRPEYLPQPYGWEVHNRRKSPNNPYNLIRAQPAPRRAAEGSPEAPTTPPGQTVPESAPRTHAALRPVPEVSSEPAAPVLHLEDAEVEDLAMIVELSQRRAPASIQDDGQRGRVRLARSAAFEGRMREYLGQRGRSGAGPVVLFVADTESGGAFYGNLTFVQSGMAFHPSPDDPLQLGVIRGRLGRLEEGGRVLGYVVLPEHLDLSRPIDIYWNDRQVTATLQP